MQVGTNGGGQTTLANSWGTFSSRRFKENIRPISDPIAKLSKLQGVYFDWKASKKPDLGLIAEDVGKVFPEIVQYEKNGKDAKGIDYSRLVAPLIEAIKEQQKEIEELRRQVMALKGAK